MIFIFDGAMGTMLQQAGLQPGQCPELWNVEYPERIADIHRQYIAHGATIIETNTFGANRIKLQHYGLSQRVVELNQAAVAAARQAAGLNIKIAGSVGPTGKFIVPLGELTFDNAYDVFYEQILALHQANVDYILIETIIDIQEMRAALLAAKAATDKPVICQLSFGDDGRTVTGTDAETAALILEAMGADIIGANCSLGPAQLLPIVEQLAHSCRCPISIQPNAGMPELINGTTIFPMTPSEFGEWVPKLVAAGATYIGGCCGTTPQHIRAIADQVQHAVLSSRPLPSTALSLTSRSKTVHIAPNLPTIIIGERINPTGRKQLAADIKAGQFLSVKKEALEQIKSGAKVLDVNMGVPGIDQAAAMKQAIEELSMLVDAPLSIDTSDAAALEAGLKAYPGRALINSVSAEPERLEQFLPLAKKYGAAILCLPISSAGVPATASERLAVIQTIIDAARAVGLRDNDFLLDALVMTIATDEQAANQTLLTLRLYREQFGFPSTMGLSNISFGLPNRPLINSAFCAMSLAAGLDAPILNPHEPSMQTILSAGQALLAHDNNGHQYSLAFAAAVNAPLAKSSSSLASDDILTLIRQTVVNGEKESIIPLVAQAIDQKFSPTDITEQALTAAMNEVGESFGAGRCFLPQVLLSAETMRAAFNTIKQLLPSHAIQSQGTVVIATVKGDIHDLGKNIVAALMENNGFKVIDLGKDVDHTAIVDAVITHKADIVGLCALMTTTMPQIDIVVDALKSSGSIAKIMVGGAVLTTEYAEQAGADVYARDGVTAVTLAKQLMNNK